MQTRMGSRRELAIRRREEDDDDLMLFLLPCLYLLSSSGGGGGSSSTSSSSNSSSSSSREKRDASISSRDKRVVARDEEPSASGAKVSTSNTRDKETGSQRDEVGSSTSREKGTGSRAQGGKSGHKRKTVEDVAEIMGKYVEVKIRQVENEAAETAHFSIKNCNALLATMEELSCEDRADAYDVFRDAQNREIFMTADPSSRLIWLRRTIRLINTSS